MDYIYARIGEGHLVLLANRMRGRSAPAASGVEGELVSTTWRYRYREMNRNR